MLLLFPNRQPFATGAALYAYQAATAYDSTPRLILQVNIEGVLTPAVLDTGAPYVICSPQVARRLRLSSTAALERTHLLIRGDWVEGGLHLLNLTFIASQGDDLTLEVTAFVPEPSFEESGGNMPSFVGLNGCLERLRFAVDPAMDTFYFGAIDEG